MSVNAQYTMTQGDSSKVFKITIEIGGVVQTLDADWNCQVVVSDKLGSGQVKKIDKVSDKSGDNSEFWAYLTPDESATLEVDNYRLTFEITNPTLIPPFKREIKRKLIIEDQGSI